MEASSQISREPATSAAPENAGSNNGSSDRKRIAYPATRKSDQIDDYHGTPVPDPYRWLEDTNAPETQEWVEAQNRLTFDYLAAISGRDQIKERLTQLWNYEKYSVPFKEGGRIFYFKNSGLQNQSVLYMAESLEAEPCVLLDPNTLSADGTVALSGLAISEDGRYMTYALSGAGSDWQEWRVRATDTAEDLSDHLKWSKFAGASWTHDGAGFFYSRYAEPEENETFQQQNLNHKLYYHRIGTPQSEDLLIYERPDQHQWLLRGRVTDDGRYLVIYADPGTEPVNRVFVKDLQSAVQPVLDVDAAPVMPLAVEGDARYGVVANEETLFYVQTTNNAPRERVVAIDLQRPAPEHWKEILPQAAETLESVSLVGERLFASYLQDAHTQIRLFTLSGTPSGEVALPGIGSAYGFGGKREDTETFYSYTSFHTPPIIYRYEISSGKSEVFREARVDFNPDDYETTQVFYASKDGTRIPMFLTYRKGLRRDGSNPVLLYGYGGFNASLTPGFSPARLVWMEMGGIYAMPNLRGGGEYGQDWHDAGRLKNKQNVFDDFIAAAEWLIANKYTSPRKLAIQGGSNGGLLVGACMNQRPDLFAAALPAVGVMDMVRFSKFTIGWAWKSDYGDPDSEDDFKTLYAYSPLHNIQPGTAYPATLITTSDHDDRVVPGHSYKFAAALQAAQAGDTPILLRVETQAGHGAGKPTTKIIEETADLWAFLARVLDMKTVAGD